MRYDEFVNYVDFSTNTVWQRAVCHDMYAMELGFIHIGTRMCCIRFGTFFFLFYSLFCSLASLFLSKHQKWSKTKGIRVPKQANKVRKSRWQNIEKDITNFGVGDWSSGVIKQI